VTAPQLRQLNVVARDVDASVAFYRLLGLPIVSDAGDQHVELAIPHGLSIEWDSAESVQHWDSGWPQGAPGPGGVVVGFALASPEEVDERYAALTTAGHVGQQCPYDAFWGARYAVVEDPDGNAVGLIGPADPGRRFWPPTTPPRA
jgi:catechol 2,3-dioxygenase-like lactoylglutathione lyase family enzyme